MALHMITVWVGDGGKKEEDASTCDYTEADKGGEWHCM